MFSRDGLEDRKDPDVEDFFLMDSVIANDAIWDDEGCDVFLWGGVVIGGADSARRARWLCYHVKQINFGFSGISSK